MEKTKNAFLQANANRINMLMKRIEEERFKSSFQGQLDLNMVLFLFNGMIREIEILQREVGKLRSKMETKDEDLTKPV